MPKINENNVFEKIISGEIPSYKIYEDDSVFAFLDSNPINKGHTLVVPKIKYRNIFDTPTAIFLKVMTVVQKLSPVIRDAVKADGINIGINNESVAGQQVFHMHVHIIPRFEEDGLKHWEGKKLSGDTMKDVLEKIQSKL